MQQSRIYNVNVGVLGHVDCGKTSLVAALSTTLSTAALDKHPQSKERGITLDLGFSAFTAPLPPHLQHLPYDLLQFTLVDCPGHASLIRTVIGGVQIIDMMLLVVDVTKGLQAQTAECLVVGEVATDRLLVVLNKVDLIPEDLREKTLKKVVKRLKQTLSITRFCSAKMVSVAARPGGGGKGDPLTGAPSSPALGITELKDHLVGMVIPELRSEEAPFLFAIDHCFPIKGQGTVMTGTVLQGSIKVGDSVELPSLKLIRPVKSLQAFHVPVQRAGKGDRLGICVAKLDPALVERGLAAAPGSVPTFEVALARVEKVRFYAGAVPGKTKYHVMVGHSTAMADVRFFGMPHEAKGTTSSPLDYLMATMAALSVNNHPPGFDWNREYLYQNQLYGLEGRNSQEEGQAAYGEDSHVGPQWALLMFEHAITCPKSSLLFGARLDSQTHGDSCRLAFYGRLCEMMTNKEYQDRLGGLKVLKFKVRKGFIDRIQADGVTAICRDAFKKETDISRFCGMEVVTGRGEVGILEGPFGKTGKFKVTFPQGLALGPRSAGENQVAITIRQAAFRKMR